MGRLEELKAKKDRTKEENEELEQLETETASGDSDDDEFDKAFDESVSEGGDKNTDIVDIDDDKDKSDQDGNADEGATGDQDSILKKPDESDDDSDEQDNDKTELELLQEENEKLTQKMKSWEGRISAANKRAEEWEQKYNETQGSSTDGKDTDKDTGKDKDAGTDGEAEKIIQDFIEEFPSLEKPIRTMAEKVANQLLEKKLDELKPMLEKIDRVESVVEESTSERHFDTITNAHEDWREIRDSGKLHAWVDKQSPVLKRSLESVLQDGTAEEVIELFDLYKESAGISKQKDRQRENDIDDKAKAHMAVDGSSGGPPKRKGKADKDDFDAAWKEAMAS